MNKPCARELLHACLPTENVLLRQLRLTVQIAGTVEAVLILPKQEFLVSQDPSGSQSMLIAGAGQEAQLSEANVSSSLGSLEARPPRMAYSDSPRQAPFTWDRSLVLILLNTFRSSYTAWQPASVGCFVALST